MIDNTSQFRMDHDVPLVVPEVNPEALARIPRNIVANPNCSTIQMVVALKPLHDKFRVRRVVVATYQSVSGAGKEGMDELWVQSKGMFVNDAPTAQQFTKPIAFNCIPHIDTFMDDGATKEEWKMVVETRKILDPDIKVHATCVRVPVFVGHSEAINVEFERPVTPAEARAVLRSAPGVHVIDSRDDGGYATQLDVAGRGRGLCQPHPPRPDGGQRARFLVRVGQSAQGRRTERGADRRDAGGEKAAQGRLTMAWLWLAMAGLFEVAWVVLLKQTDGFRVIGWSLATVAAMGCSFGAMSQALRVLPMGTVYAVWTGIGAAGGLVWGILFEGEPAGMVRIACVLLILAGVAGLRLT